VMYDLDGRHARDVLLYRVNGAACQNNREQRKKRCHRTRPERILRVGPLGMANSLPRICTHCRPHQNATHSSTQTAAQRASPRPGSSRKRSSFLRVVTFVQTRPTERCPATPNPSKQSVAIQLHQIILRARSRLSDFDFNYRLVKATTLIGRFLLFSVAQMKHRE